MHSVSFYAEKDMVTIRTYNSAAEPIDMHFKTVPQKVLVVENDNLETLIALGQAQRIAFARFSSHSETGHFLERYFPEELHKIGILSRYIPDAETAISLQPDFILAWKSIFSRRYLGSTDWWNVRGINTYIVATSNRTVPYGTVNDEIKYIEDMGRIFHAERRANKIVEQIRQVLAEIQAKTRRMPRPRVMVVEIGERTVLNYKADWLVGDMIAQLGGYLCPAKDDTSIEELIDINPDVIFVVTFNDRTKSFVDTIISDRRFQSLKAVQERRVYPIPLSLMYSTGVRTGDGLVLLAEGMYPGIQIESKMDWADLSRMD